MHFCQSCESPLYFMNDSYNFHPSSMMHVEPITLKPVDLGPPRIPKVYREVVYAPRPPPIYKRFVHREPTPTQEIIERYTIRRSPDSYSSYDEREVARSPYKHTRPNRRRYYG